MSIIQCIFNLVWLFKHLLNSQAGYINKTYAKKQKNNYCFFIKALYHIRYGKPSGLFSEKTSYVMPSALRIQNFILFQYLWEDLSINWKLQVLHKLNRFLCGFFMTPPFLARRCFFCWSDTVARSIASCGKFIISSTLV